LKLPQIQDFFINTLQEASAGKGKYSNVGENIVNRKVVESSDSGKKTTKK
jgi:hypothetical protein